MEPKIIFEDQDLLVLDKPAGMIVNRSDTTKGERTVQEWVESYLVIPNCATSAEESPLGGVRDLLPAGRSPDNKNEMLKQVQHDNYEEQAKLAFVARAGIVHRLDKETSGILLVAKTLPAFLNLQSQFKERKVQKTYLALAHGKIDPPTGTIDVEVGRLPWNRKRFGVLSGGRGAMTMYKVLSIMYYVSGINKEPLSLVELSPKTGRTHQIRVHLQYIKHPIFADPLYAGRKTGRNDRKLLPRIFLHASKISFSHPKTSKLLSFETPLPKELEEFVGKLSNN